ncbi:Protein of unknown function (DUF541) [Abditibacterium utsteinense]|uniref:DUF541 domain-containing protein n=1 Tax=Abditibacterium utsteinense TaxID=1960156 RepID=A0A2S8SUD7_9BACT|nr:SIMPL domain-containing protein [Abditibacterium utsteinense]PQV64411.1 Protein of unknown function (DUF541) [Abditibacterium utsteinense]
MSAHPDIISIEAAQSARVEAERADILVTVAGASLFSGAMALQKAREVAELVAVLKTIGVEESQIKVEGVRAQTQSGTFSKTSSVSYSLRVENVPLSRIADAVGAITGARNATLNHLEWRFADETPLRDDLRERCLQIAIQRAGNIAQTLGVRLIGVYELNEEWQGTRDETPDLHQQYDGMARARSVRVSEEELGLSISHAETVHLKLTIQFRVSEIRS